MRLALCTAGILSLLATPAFGQTDAELSTPTTGELSPGVAHAVEFMRAKQWGKTLLYVELDDERADGAVLRFDVVGRVPGVDALLGYDKREVSDLIDALRPDIPKPAAPGWRRIAIIVEGDDVTVSPGPRAGSMESFPGRMHNLIDRVFPGHS